MPRKRFNLWSTINVSVVPGNPHPQTAARMDIFGQPALAAVNGALVFAPANNPPITIKRRKTFSIV